MLVRDKHSSLLVCKLEGKCRIVKTAPEVGLSNIQVQLEHHNKVWPKSYLRYFVNLVTLRAGAKHDLRRFSTKYIWEKKMMWWKKLATALLDLKKQILLDKFASAKTSWRHYIIIIIDGFQFLELPRLIAKWHSPLAKTQRTFNGLLKRGARYLTGENLKLARAEYSTLSQAVLLNSNMS